MGKQLLQQPCTRVGSIPELAQIMRTAMYKSLIFFKVTLSNSDTGGKVSERGKHHSYLPFGFVSS